MKPGRALWILPFIVAVLGAAAIIVWLREGVALDAPLRLPAQETGPAPGSIGLAVERNPGALICGAGRPSSLSRAWPQFRGVDRTNIVHDAGRLAREWPESGPRVLWELEVGEGYAGAAIRNGCVYLVDYDREKREDAVRCLSLDDAAEIWRYTYYVKVKRNHGMSRTVPAVTENHIVSLGPKGHVCCLDAGTGDLVWKLDLVKDCGTEIPPWYAGQCPLIDGDVVILAPGARPLMAAVELATGRRRWETENPGNWGMTHASITPMDFHGERQYVYCTTRGALGVSAKDGRILWQYPGWVIKLATVPSPVIVGENRILFSGGYNSGCAMIRLRQESAKIEIEEVWRLEPATFGSDQQTPILFENHIYGVAPGGQLICLDLDGRRVWTSGAANRFGLGPFLLADGLLFVLNDQRGTLHAVAADPAGYREWARAKLLDGHDAWAPMAMAAGRLILRDATTMICIKVPGAVR